ncbi:MAG: YfiR family protein, partial [Calditrichia bacterium]|nr:YfiR family protein [Calditrichia bacterium]
ILILIKNKPILTISDKEDFAEKGGHINFYIKSKKLKFTFNPDMFFNSNLYVSHLLLKAAKIVNFKD